MGAKISINYESDNEKYNNNEKSKAALKTFSSSEKSFSAQDSSALALSGILLDSSFGWLCEMFGLKSGTDIFLHHLLSPKPLKFPALNWLVFHLLAPSYSQTAPNIHCSIFL